MKSIERVRVSEAAVFVIASVFAWGERTCFVTIFFLLLPLVDKSVGI